MAFIWAQGHALLGALLVESTGVVYDRRVAQRVVRT
jgi:hypothetical protein